MIPKSLDEVTEDVLDHLIKNQISERRTIEKQTRASREQLREREGIPRRCVIIANCAGGDLAFGIDEDRGIPTKITALQSGDFDLEIRRLDSLLASGLTPRIRSAMKAVECARGRVLVIRIERNWVGPHRVILQEHDKF